VTLSADLLGTSTQPLRAALMTTAHELAHWWEHHHGDGSALDEHGASFLAAAGRVAHVGRELVGRFDSAPWLPAPEDFYGDAALWPYSAEDLDADPALTVAPA
jgi:hypothetical protein